MSTKEKDFLDLVEEYQSKHKCSRTDAMCVIMRRNPTSHRRYIEAANSTSGFVQKEPLEERDFEGLVEGYSVQHECGKKEAILAVRRRYPSKFADYINQVNGGPENV